MEEKTSEFVFLQPGTPAYQDFSNFINSIAYQNRNGIHYAPPNKPFQPDSCSLTLQNIDAFIEEKGFLKSDPVSYKTLKKVELNDNFFVQLMINL